MKHFVVIALAIAVTGVIGSGVQAQASDLKPSIGVTGEVAWSEPIKMITILHDTYGLPIHNACYSTDTRCITLLHYSKADGLAGDSEILAGTHGDLTIRFNDFYGKTASDRLETSYHEFGHALGLEHSSGCKSSMEVQIARCGYNALGYSPNEQTKLHQIWG